MAGPAFVFNVSPKLKDNVQPASFMCTFPHNLLRYPTWQTIIAKPRRTVGPSLGCPSVVGPAHMAHRHVLFRKGPAGYNRDISIRDKTTNLGLPLVCRTHPRGLPTTQEALASSSKIVWGGDDTCERSGSSGRKVGPAKCLRRRIPKLRRSRSGRFNGCRSALSHYLFFGDSPP
jgi:hypothetical protein